MLTWQRLTLICINYIVLLKTTQSYNHNIIANVDVWLTELIYLKLPFVLIWWKLYLLTWVLIFCWSHVILRTWNQSLSHSASKNMSSKIKCYPQLINKVIFLGIYMFLHSHAILGDERLFHQYQKHEIFWNSWFPNMRITKLVNMEL